MANKNWNWTELNTKMFKNVGVFVPKETLINTCVEMPIGFTHITSSTARTCKLINNTWFKRIGNKILRTKHSAKFERRENNLNIQAFAILVNNGWNFSCGVGTYIHNPYIHNVNNIFMLHIFIMADDDDVWNLETFRKLKSVVVFLKIIVSFELTRPIQSTFSQSQVLDAHKQKNLRACSPFQLYQTRDFGN